MKIVSGEVSAETLIGQPETMRQWIQDGRMEIYCGTGISELVSRLDTGTLMTKMAGLPGRFRF